MSPPSVPRVPHCGRFLHPQEVVDTSFWTVPLSPRGFRQETVYLRNIQARLNHGAVERVEDNMRRLQEFHSDVLKTGTYVKAVVRAYPRYRKMEACLRDLLPRTRGGNCEVSQNAPWESTPKREGSKREGPLSCIPRATG